MNAAKNAVAREECAYFELNVGTDMLSLSASCRATSAAFFALFCFDFFFLTPEVPLSFNEPPANDMAYLFLLPTASIIWKDTRRITMAIARTLCMRRGYVDKLE
jgi:hypothetical protein